VGQGALGIEILAGRAELAALLVPLNDAVTAACVHAERAMSRALNGSCQVPLGGYAIQRGDMLVLNGFVASVDGRTFLTARAEAPCRYADSLGRAVARQLLDQGAGDIIAALDQ
jgi:hydroxymethylbilane synthase